MNILVLDHIGQAVGTKNKQIAFADRLFLDLDFDGRQTPGEPGIEGVGVHLYESDSTLVGSTTTDSSGNFLFEKNRAGEYFLEFELPLTYSFTEQDFGAYRIADASSKAFVVPDC